MNPLVSSRIKEVRENHLLDLDLSNLGLDEFPNEIFELTWLEALSLGSEYLDPNKKNDALRNKIQIIPPDISLLTNLVYLDIRGNAITDISALKKCISLEDLVLAGNKISKIDTLAFLENLQRLKIEDNQINDLSPLKNLHKISDLNLHGNDITSIDALRNMKDLEYLELAENKIWDLSPIAELENIHTLYLYNNKIEDLTPISNYTRLVKLYLFINRISDLHPIKNLVNLELLWLGSNLVKDITPLQDLINLKSIDLNYNKVENISPLIDFIERGLEIITRDKSFSNEGINIEGNPIVTPPPEIVEQGGEAILRYFKEIEKGTYKLNEARLLIVGQGGAGKTSLRKKLIDTKAGMPAPSDTTRGIEIDTIQIKLGGELFNLHIWDFGGQNIQHYAHQFFLTDNSLYVLISNEREQNANFRYWLHIIEMLGKNSPVILVQNEINGHCEGIRNLAAIRERFENVQTPIHKVDILNADTDLRFAHLKKDIFHFASSLSHVGKEYPVSYLKVKNQLHKEVNKKKDFITWQEYKELCENEGIKDENLMADIANSFHFLGTCLYFSNDIELRNYILLNPKWIIDALFILLYHPKLVAQNGEFSEDDIVEIWPNNLYSNMHAKLLRMLERFELAYRIKDTNSFIVPQRLPAALQSYKWNEKEVVKMEYKYKFMPKGIITRITCRLHEKIKDQHVWNDAVVFQHRDSRVFVREVYSEEKIAIEAAGAGHADLLNRVIDEIDNIHLKSKYANLIVEKRVPCSCSVCISAKEPFFFNYDFLCQLLEDGETVERCQVSRKMINIREILQATGIKYVEKSEKSKLRGIQNIEETSQGKIKVFLSYSHKDERLKGKLDNHFSALKRSNLISTWNDRKIGGGNEWDESIKQQLNEADIILLLISADFMASEYIWEVEIKRAIERHHEKSACVIPIFLRDCDFKNMPFEKLQGYPKDAKALMSFSANKRDLVFSDISKGIRTDVESWKKV